MAPQKNKKDITYMFFKIHRINFLLVILVFSFGCGNKLEKTKEVKEYFIISKNGLNVRDQPSLHGKILTTLPYLSTVQLIKQKSNLITIQGKTGVWFFVRNGSKRGWLFSGYLQEKIFYSNFLFRRVSSNMSRNEIKYFEKKSKLVNETSDCIAYHIRLWGVPGKLSYFLSKNTLSSIEFRIKLKNVNYDPTMESKKSKPLLKKLKVEAYQQYQKLKKMMKKEYGTPSKVDIKKQISGGVKQGGAYYSDDLITEWTSPNRMITLTYSNFTDVAETYRVVVRIYGL